MYVVVETWTPKPAFLSLSSEQRTEFFAAVAAGMAGAAEVGVESLGWGRLDPCESHGSEHAWFALWRTRDAEAADTFLRGVGAAGWYEYFDQTNLRGELRPAGAVMAEHAELAS